MMTSPAAKRRRVRKGTQSCWECKRRKVRCTFLAAAATGSSQELEPGQPRPRTCDGCRSRGTKCISQEFDYSVEVETQTPAKIALPTARPDRPPPTTSRPLVPAFSVPNSHQDISLALAAAWPTPAELGGILSVKKGTAVLYHGLIFMPYDEFLPLANHEYSPENLLQLPRDPSAVHPVLLARRLLLLGKPLLGMSDATLDGAIAHTATRKRSRREIMQQVIKAATRLVSSDDSLVSGTLDGIECVMFESMYLNNEGHLKRAWLTNRKAMFMAQLLGMHNITRDMKEPPVLSNATRRRIDPEIMWFRLVMTDCYLSLLLGQEPESSATQKDQVLQGFASEEVTAKCTPLEKLERLMTLVAGRILRPWYTSKQETMAWAYHTLGLSDNDNCMRKAAKFMSPQWWAGLNSDTEDELEQTLRVTTQLAYYQILIQLHLPHMLLPELAGKSHYTVDEVRKSDHSRSTAAHASRSILTQFVALHARNNGPDAQSAYCRGVDFVAFVACATLCLAHIENRRRHFIECEGHTLFEASDCLEHQRLSDRALLERTVEIMQADSSESLLDHAGGRSGDDVVAHKMAILLEPLLLAEEEVAAYEYWTVMIVPLGDKRHERAAPLGTSSIEIPHLGTIVLRRPPLRPPEQTVEPNVFHHAADPLPAGEDWSMQGVDMAMFDSLLESLAYLEPDGWSDKTR